ncbi:MAG: hypothetical protein IT371_20715 [Deltaproteobacteria bacterium]|nr:hypothetical protein [Deltaproteobacteria bacterium]
MARVSARPPLAGLALIPSALVLSALALLAPRALHAAPSRLRSAVERFADERGLRPRVVRVGPAARLVDRLFVPLPPAAYDAFLEHFSAPRGYVNLQYDGDTHVSMAVEPGDCYYWGLNFNGRPPENHDLRPQFQPRRQGCIVFPVDLEGQRLAHLKGWLRARENPAANPYRYPGGPGINCMTWLGNAEVEPGLPFFHALGLRRSRDGRNLKAKLLHAANEAVPCVGVFVPDQATFDAMSVEQLLGPPPGGGVDDAAR